MNMAPTHLANAVVASTILAQTAFSLISVRLFFDGGGAVRAKAAALRRSPTVRVMITAPLF